MVNYYGAGIARNGATPGYGKATVTSTIPKEIGGLRRPMPTIARIIKTKERRMYYANSSRDKNRKGYCAMER